MNRTFWKEQILDLAISMSSFTLLLEKIANQQRVKSTWLSPGSRFPVVMFSTVPCPTFYVAASLQRTMMGFHRFLQCWHNCKAFHQYSLPGFCSRKQMLLVWLTLQMASLFWLPWPSHAMQNDSHQPRQAVREGLMTPSLAPHLQHAWCCRQPRKLIPFSHHQSIFFFQHSFLVTYYNNSVLNSKCTKFNNHWTAHRNINQVTSW